MQYKEIIRQYLNDHNITSREFARKCGLADSYVSTLLTGVNPSTKKELKPTMATYQRIAKGMGISLDGLLSMTGHVTSATASHDAPAPERINNLQGLVILHVADIAPVLGVNPQSIRSQAQADPSRLGFPVSVIGNRVLIPKWGFLNWFYHTNEFKQSERD